MPTYAVYQHKNIGLQTTFGVAGFPYFVCDEDVTNPAVILCSLQAGDTIAGEQPVTIDKFQSGQVYHTVIGDYSSSKSYTYAFDIKGKEAIIPVNVGGTVQSSYQQWGGNPQSFRYKNITYGNAGYGWLAYTGTGSVSLQYGFLCIVYFSKSEKYGIYRTTIGDNFASISVSNASLHKFGAVATDMNDATQITLYNCYIGVDMTAVVTDLIANSPVPNPDPYTPDPDGPDGPSEPGGGEGDRDDVDVPVPIPGLPPISAADTGFVTLFNPNSAQIKNLANYMWSSGFDIATFKNIVANPIDCILGLNIIPFTPNHGDPDTVKVGNIDTGLSFPTVANQFQEIDCGSVQVSEYWGSYLDYSPYTKISLYLPYIGIVPLDIDEVQGKALAIKYHVDVLSGACIAYLLCGTSVLYSYIGQCSCNVPITSNDFTNTVNGVLGIAGNIGSLVAVGGMSSPFTAAGSAIKAGAAMASNAINMLKPNVQKSGAMAGTGGLMGTQYPYIIKQRPRQSVPAGQNTFKGYPSNIAVKLGDLSGYTEVDEVHLDGIPATDAEMNEILQLLSEGVYI
jgi:hypothetical protein